MKFIVPDWFDVKIVRDLYKPFKEFIGFLNARQRNVIVWLFFLLLLTNIFDILGILLVGVLLSISVKGLQSQNINPNLEDFLVKLHLSGLSLQNQVALLALVTVLFFITKSILSVSLNRIWFKKLAEYANQITKNYLEKIFTLRYQTFNHKSLSAIQYDLSFGINSLFVEIPGFFVLCIIDIILVILLISALFFLDPFVAVFTLIGFSSLGVILNRFFSRRSRQIGQEYSKSAVNLSQEIANAFSIFNEIRLRGLKQEFVNQIQFSRNSITGVTWRSNFYPTVGKYIFESASMLFAVSLAAFEFVVKDAVSAISVLTAFMAASSRIAPAVLRIQQSISMLVMNREKAQETRNFLQLIDSSYSEAAKISVAIISHDNSAIKLHEVSYRYPGVENYALKNVDLNIPRGQFTAIVGPSGSGKSTLVKLLIDTDLPTFGKVTLFGKTAKDFIVSNPGKIGYVPQKVEMLEGDIYFNIAMKKNTTKDEKKRVEELLELVELEQLIPLRNNGTIFTYASQKSELSGGQIQRVGIARALFSDPDLIILDEATSALDAKSEENIRNLISKLQGKKTLLVIAHRLSTIKNADSIVYLDHGKVLGVGNFENLKIKLPDFASQLQILGL